MIRLRGNAHLDDATLLLLLEGELSPARTRRAERHLRNCAVCSGRRQRFVAGDEFLASAGTHDNNSAAGEADTARHDLQTNLSSIVDTEPRTLWQKFRRSVVLRPRTLLRAAAVCLLLVLAAIFRQLDLPLQDRMAAYEETGPKPDHALTPGAVNTISLAEVCARSDDDLDPPVTPEKQRAVFRAYRMNDRAARAYQVDYLINPQLGGSDALENLWPEPYHATVWNAKAKDALETRLHGLVCSGQIGLEAAQRELSTDWIEAYKRHFHASRPVSTVAGTHAAPPVGR